MCLGLSSQSNKRLKIARGRLPCRLLTAPDDNERAAESTRGRLIQAAGALFAERGYAHASVREICGHAGANLAAVKYHFGNKAGLYRAVLLDSHEGLRDQEPLPRLAEARSPEAALRAQIGFMLRFLLLRRPAHSFAGQLIARELQAPTEALTDLVRLVMRPVREALEETIAALLGDADSPARRGQLTNFVFGLCAFHEFGRPVLERFGFAPPRVEAEVDPLADAIAAFALGGIRRTRDRARRTGNQR